MLQLSGILFNSVRTLSRYTWWTTTQNFLTANSMAIKLNPEIDFKNRQHEKIPSRSKNYDSTLITAAFKSLQISKENDSEISKQLIDRVNSAKNVNDLLNFSKDPQFNKQLASTIIQVLFNWISTEKVNINNIISDRRYIKICDTLEISVNPSDQLSNTKVLHRIGIKEVKKSESSLNELLQTITNKNEIEKLSVPQMINVLTILASKQKRLTPVLQVIAAKIVTSEYKFNIKELGDILYSVTVLNFYDKNLMQNVCKNLLYILPKDDRSAVIRSILTSLGLLRYRDECLINLLSAWIVEHKSIIKPQEINSLLMTLACLGYIPENFSLILTSIIKPLKESDMCESSEWLDTVWSLCILNQANLQHYESVLNSDFLNRIDEVSVSRSLKILNINAAARLLVTNYKGPLLPDDSKFFNILIKRTKEKTELSNSIVSALKILLPADATYLDTYINTNMGFLIDAEFCIDYKCTPVPLNSKSQENIEIFKIAVMSCSYQEFCRGITEVMGPIKFYKNLLETNGYKVLLIPYTDINVGDSLTSRVNYIKNKIILLLQNV